MTSEERFLTRGVAQPVFRGGSGETDSRSVSLSCARRQSNFPAQSNVARMIQGRSVMWNRSGNRQSVQASESAKCTGRAVCFSSPWLRAVLFLPLEQR